MVVPKYDYVVTIEVTQLGVKLDMVVSVTMTIRSLKARISKDQGYPVDRMDLMFRDQPMENQRHLFDYRVGHGSTIFCMLHLIYDMKVTVSKPNDWQTVQCTFMTVCMLSEKAWQLFEKIIFQNKFCALMQHGSFVDLVYMKMQTSKTMWVRDTECLKSFIMNLD